MNHHIDLLARTGPATSRQSRLSPVGLSILRCTAQALINTPGGLQFVPGSHPWLENLQTP